MIDALLKAYPDAARKRNMHGYLPLHFAVLYLAPPAVISSLLDVYPEACLAKDRDNNIALHWAAQSAISVLNIFIAFVRGFIIIQFALNKVVFFGWWSL